MSLSMQAMEQAAQQATSQGRWQDAERIWVQMRQLDPKNPKALHGIGVCAYRRGDAQTALRLLQQSHLLAPDDPMVLMSVAVVLKAIGDIEGEAQTIEALLTLDPYHLGGLLAKAAHVESRFGARAAAQHYRNALQAAPPEPRWPPVLREQLLQARGKCTTYGEELAAHLATALARPQQRLSAFEAERWREAGAVLAGQTKPYPSLPNRLLVPRLPAIPFFDREQFPWARAIEARTAEIRREFEDAYRLDDTDFQPYVAYAPGTPVNQWHELNHSKRWSSYFLWRDGQAQAQHQQRCPITTAALGEIDLARLDGICPNAMFSALAPQTHIPPHHGETNARLVVHLPLIVPPNCSYRVGFERRQWQVGEVLIFDDSIEHEARNDSDELRVVLIFDVWNPLLSIAEREMVQQLHMALAEFHPS